MLRIAFFAVALICVAFGAASCTGSGAMLYCLAVDHDINRRCT